MARMISGREAGVETFTVHKLALPVDDCRLFCRLPDVAGRLFRDGLGVLLMATLFPVMVNVGISRGAAAAICASGRHHPLANVWRCGFSRKSGGDAVNRFAFKPRCRFPSPPLSVWRLRTFSGNAIWIKENIHEMLDVAEITTTAPAFCYALAVHAHYRRTDLTVNGAAVAHYYHSDLYAAEAPCWRFVRGFNTQNVFSNLGGGLSRGMADRFAGVVMLLVAAGVFARGLSTIGFIQSLISIATSFGSASHYSDAGLDFNHAGRDDHRFGQCAFTPLLR